jgi:hypothetical protein
MADNRDVMHITKFSGTNFHIWSFQMCMAFLGREIMGVVDGSEHKPVGVGEAPPDPVAVAAWVKKDNLGISSLC